MPTKLTPYKISNPSKAMFLEIVGPDTVTAKPNTPRMFQVFFLGVEMGQVERINERSYGYFAGGRDNFFPTLQEAAESRCGLMLRKESYCYLPKLLLAWDKWIAEQKIDCFTGGLKC